MKYLNKIMCSIILAFSIITGFGGAAFAHNDIALATYISTDVEGSINNENPPLGNSEGGRLGLIFIGIGVLVGGILYINRDKFTS